VTAGERRDFADRRGLPGPHEERGLKGVLGILIVAQDIAANAPDQPPVPPHQLGKRRNSRSRAAGREPRITVPTPVEDAADVIPLPT